MQKVFTFFRACSIVLFQKLETLTREIEMTVFVVQEAKGRNVTSARRFGSLEVLLDSQTNIQITPAPAVRRIRQRLGKFDDDDYLLLMGDPAAIGLACAIAANINQGRFNLLKWDRQEQDYYPVAVDIHQRTEDLTGNLHV